MSLPLFEDVKNILLKLVTTIHNLSYDEYNKRIPELSNASIGEHCRHIIELFEQLNNGYQSGMINYDNRKRDVRLQSDIDFATEAIAIIIKQLDKPNKQLILVYSLCNEKQEIESNYLRELFYNLEHCIHHQAIIKIGMLHFNLQVNDETFGIAKSTLEYRKQCVQ